MGKKAKAKANKNLHNRDLQLTTSRLQNISLFFKKQRPTSYPIYFPENNLHERINCSSIETHIISTQLNSPT
jgi:hypothetical protein